MDTFTVIIVVTFIGFTALAAVLLVPVYRFLKREEKASRKWTSGSDAASDRSAERPSANGTGPHRDAW